LEQNIAFIALPRLRLRGEARFAAETFRSPISQPLRTSSRAGRPRDARRSPTRLRSSATMQAAIDEATRLGGARVTRPLLAFYAAVRCAVCARV
jgi:hypothetical protein